MRDRPTDSLERALEILEMLERTPGGLRHADLTRRMRIPKSTCSYILSKLERKGYLSRDPESGRFKIGLTPVALAHGALREIGVRSIAEPALYRLTNETGLSAGVGVLERGRVLIIDRVEGPQFAPRDAGIGPLPARRRAAEIRARERTREQRDVGRELPAHSTALGKVLLAWLSDTQLQRLIATRGLDRRTPRTIVSQARLLEELQQVRQQKFAIADEEAYVGVRALSAPIFDATGEVRAAVSVNGTPSDEAWSRLETLVPLVQETAREISRRMRF